MTYAPPMSKHTCQISWIDDHGNPTPDENEAVAQVRLPAHVAQINGRGGKIDTSEWFNICAEQRKQLADPDMHLWEERPLPVDASQ